MTQTMIAYIIAYTGDKAVKYLTRGAYERTWSTEKILTVAAGSMLAMYAMKLTYEYIQECRGGGEDGSFRRTPNSLPRRPSVAREESPLYHLAREPSPRIPQFLRLPENDPTTTYSVVPIEMTVEENEDFQTEDVEVGMDTAKTEKLPLPGRGDIDIVQNEKSLMSARGMEVVSTTGAVPPAEKGSHHEKKDEFSRSKTLFIVAFVGSVDDLTLFVPMLVGKGFNLAQLMVGSFLAVVTIVLICIFLGLCKPFADFVERIPLALVVVVFATYLLGKASFME